MYIIQYNRVFNTDCFGALKMDEREIIFYTPGMSGRVPKSSEDNSIYFFREDNVKAAFRILIEALCDGQCRAIRFEERFGDKADGAHQPELLVEKFHKNNTSRTEKGMSKSSKQVGEDRELNKKYG